MREQIYRGHRIRVDRQPTLGGWITTSIWVERNDGLVLVDEQTEGEDTERQLLGYMRDRVDEAIVTKGESECCDDDWGGWQEPKRCPQCHVVGAHKMSCSDPSNPRQGGVTVPVAEVRP